MPAQIRGYLYRFKILTEDADDKSDSVETLKMAISHAIAHHPDNIDFLNHIKLKDTYTELFCPICSHNLTIVSSTPFGLTGSVTKHVYTCKNANCQGDLTVEHRHG